MNLAFFYIFLNKANFSLYNYVYFDGRGYKSGRPFIEIFANVIKYIFKMNLEFLKTLKLLLYYKNDIFFFFTPIFFIKKKFKKKEFQVHLNH
jgi:hypothetical protein